MQVENKKASDQKREPLFEISITVHEPSAQDTDYPWTNREVVIVGDNIWFGDRYGVPLDRVSKPEAILGCVDHLAGKCWMTVEMLRSFVQTAAHHHGLKIHPF